jgi:hypothetical protein
MNKVALSVGQTFDIKLTSGAVPGVRFMPHFGFARQLPLMPPL